MKEFYKNKLKNGPTILFEKRNLPIVTIIAATRVGAAHETEKIKGLAHFTEHMLFKGTPTRTQQQISSAIEKTGGILNGFTSEQITAFWCKLPSRHMNLGANIIFDMVQNPKFDPKEIEKEKGVIVSEISRKHDLPQQWIFDKTKELLYKKPFASSVLGSKETVNKFNRKSFTEWHKFYDPSDLIISVVGNADFEEIKELANRYFHKESNPLPNLNIIPLNKKTQFIEKRRGIDQAHFTLAFQAPKLSESGRYGADVFNSILGKGMSSWLFQEVREKRGWAYTIHSFMENEKDYGHCIIYAGIEKKNLKKVNEIVLKEIKRFKNLKQRDFEQAKEQCIGNWELNVEDSETVAVNLTFQEIATKAEDFYDYSKKISDVKIQEVKNLAKIKNYVTVALVPEK